MGKQAHSEAFYERRLKRFAPDWEVMLSDSMLLAEIYSVIQFGGENKAHERKKKAVTIRIPLVRGGIQKALAGEKCIRLPTQLTSASGAPSVSGVGSTIALRNR